MNKPKMITAKFATPKDVIRRHSQLAQLGAMCGATDPQGYVCTLDPGHKGDHHAQNTRNETCSHWAQK